MADQHLLLLKNHKSDGKRWPLYKLQSLPPNKFMKEITRILNRQAVVFLTQPDSITRPVEEF